MGLSFGKGDMTIELERFEYHPGDEITGTLKLDLKKPYKADGIEVELFGQETIQTRSGGETKTKHVTICQIKIPLDGKKEYDDAEYEFKIPIPSDVLGTPSNVKAPSGVLGDVVGVVNALGGSSRRLKFYVKGRLDIPWAIDVTEKQTIVINP